MSEEKTSIFDLEVPGWSDGKLFDGNRADRHIYLVSDGTFAAKNYDIGTVTNVYIELGGKSIPYHYVIKHCDSNLEQDGNPICHPAGTIFRTKQTSYLNEMADVDSGRSDRRIAPGDIVICTTLPSGSWFHTEENAVVTESMLALLKYLMGYEGISIGNVHNWYNYGDGDYAFNEESFQNFIYSLKSYVATKQGMVGVFEGDDGVMLSVESYYPSGATLEEIATLILGENATKQSKKEYMQYLVETNPDIWDSVDSKKKSGRFVNVGNGNFSKSVVSKLRARGIYQDLSESELNVSAGTIASSSTNKAILEEWNDPADVHRTGDEQTRHTTRGGKSEQAWRYTSLRFPGYHNALLQFNKQDGSDPVLINFIVSPSEISESRSNTVNNIKTMGGWVGQRVGRNPIQIRFTGHMLDIKENLERHRFLDEVYKKYLEDQKNSSYAYYNEYRCKLIVEGRDYYGYVTGLNLSKVATSPFLYSYNISFVAYNDKRVYNPDEAVVSPYDIFSGNSNPSLINGVASSPEEVYKLLNQMISDGLISQEAADLFEQQLLDLGAGTPEYYARLSTAAVLLQSYVDSQDWSKEYLKWFLTTSNESGIPYISSIDKWVDTNGVPYRSDIVALLDKMTGTTINGLNSDAGIRWDQPLIVSLNQKRIIRDLSSWLDSGGYPVYPEDERISRGLLCALCDNIKGEADSCKGASMSSEDLMESLRQNAADPSAVQNHWVNKHVYSLFVKGCISSPIDSYWLEDPEAMASNEYSLALIKNSFLCVSVTRPASDYMPSNASDDVSKAIAVKYVDSCTGGVWPDPQAKPDVRWDAPHIYSLGGKGILIPDAEGVRNFSVWIDWATSTPQYPLNQLLSRNEALVLCDALLGSSDFTWDDGKSDEDIRNFFTDNGYTVRAWHDAYKHLYSLINKQVVDMDNAESVRYWIEDPEATCASGMFQEIISTRAQADQAE